MTGKINIENKIVVLEKTQFFVSYKLHNFIFSSTFKLMLELMSGAV